MTNYIRNAIIFTVLAAALAGCASDRSAALRSRAHQGSVIDGIWKTDANGHAKFIRYDDLTADEKETAVAYLNEYAP